METKYVRVPFEVELAKKITEKSVDGRIVTRVETGSTVKASEYRGTNDGGFLDTKDDAWINGIIYCLKLI